MFISVLFYNTYGADDSHILSNQNSHNQLNQTNWYILSILPISSATFLALFLCMKIELFTFTSLLFCVK